VLHMHTLKPLDVEGILEHASQVKAVITIEEHRKFGGLGSAVAENLLEAGMHKSFSRLGFPDVFTEEHGSQAEIMQKYGITPENAVAKAIELLK